MLKLKRNWEELVRDELYTLIHQGVINEDKMKFAVYETAQELERLN